MQCKLSIGHASAGFEALFSVRSSVSQQQRKLTKPIPMNFKSSSENAVVQIYQLLKSYKALKSIPCLSSHLRKMF